MVSSSFNESDGVLSKPSDMSVEQCDPLSIARRVTQDNVPVVISCWKLTKDELEEFGRTGRIWLLVVGNSMPPVSLTANSPFGA